MITSELKYPVIVITKDGYIDVCVDEDTLNTMNRVSFKKKTSIGATIVDSDCKAVEIKDVRFVSGKGSFWGWTIFLDRLITVEHILGEPYYIPLDNVKKKVLADLRRSIRSIPRAEGIRDDMRKIKETQTMQELMSIVLPYYDIRPIWKNIKHPTFSKEKPWGCE